MSETDVLKMKVADLKRELRVRGLPISGNKTELQERLQTSLIDGEFTLDDTAISEDLLDEDNVLTDEEEQAALASPSDEKDLLASPKTSESCSAQIMDSKILNAKSQNEEQTAQKKIVILKRKASTNTISITESSTGSVDVIKTLSEAKEKIKKIEFNNDENKTTNGSTDLDGGNKKVAKISELSLKERMDLRAKKFGTDNSVVVIDDNGSVGERKKVLSKDPKTIEALKKRAERFGCVLSPQMAEIEKQEKLLKRKERFGENDIGSSITTTTATGVSTSVYAEKARLRLERFKTDAK